MVDVQLRSKALVMEFDGGIVSGKQKIVTKSFSSVNEAALDEKLYSTAQTLSALQEKDLIRVNKRELSEIS